MASPILGLVISAISKVGPGLSSALSSVKSFASSTKTVISSIFKTIGTIVKIGGGIVTGITGAIIYFVKGFIDAEKATFRLDRAITTIGKNMGYVKTSLKDANGAVIETAGAVDKMVEAITGLTAFSPEEIKGVITELIRSEKVKPENLVETAMAIIDVGRAINDLPLATKIRIRLLADPADAITLLDKSIFRLTADEEKQVELLKKWGSDAEITSFALKILNRDLGTESAYLKTTSGSLSQAINSYDELRETIGGLISESFELPRRFKEFKDAIDNLTKSGELKKWVNTNLAVFSKFFDMVSAWKEVMLKPDDMGKRSILIDAKLKFGEELKASIKSFFDFILNIAEEYMDTFVQIGTLIGEGIVYGIKNAILSGFKGIFKALGNINSPKEFWQEVKDDFSGIKPSDRKLANELKASEKKLMPNKDEYFKELVTNLEREKKGLPPTYKPEIDKKTGKPETYNKYLERNTENFWKLRDKSDAIMRQNMLLKQESDKNEKEKIDAIKKVNKQLMEQYGGVEKPFEPKVESQVEKPPSIIQLPKKPEQHPTIGILDAIRKIEDKVIGALDIFDFLTKLSGSEKPKSAKELQQKPPEIITPKVDVTIPTVNVPDIKIPTTNVTVSTPEVNVSIPEVKIPTIDLDTPYVEKVIVPAESKIIPIEPTPAPDITLPDISTPEVNVIAPEINIPVPEVNVSTPNVSIPVPEVTVNAPDVTIPVPEVNVSTPNVSIPVPEVTVNAPDVSIPVPEVNVSTPEVTIPVPEVTVNAPDVSIPTPEIVVNAPQVSIPVPEVNVSTPEVSIPVPEVAVNVPEVNIPTPSIEVSSPEVSIPTPDIEVKSPEVNVPESIVNVPETKIDIPTAQINVDAPDIVIPSQQVVNESKSFPSWLMSMMSDNNKSIDMNTDSLKSLGNIVEIAKTNLDNTPDNIEINPVLNNPDFSGLETSQSNDTDKIVYALNEVRASVEGLRAT